MKTFTVKLNEDELKHLISFHAKKMGLEGAHNIETSARIHDLTKRLNKETPEIETEVKNADNEQVQEAAKW